MPRAEKSTSALKLDLERVKERYERAVEKDNRKIAAVVHKYLGEEPDLKRLEAYLARIGSETDDPVSPERESPAVKVQTGKSRYPYTREQSVPEPGTGEDDG
ncbi:MAG: hypothetical protein K5921_06850 [Lachnospiraceae bacterium]|nr:hypothetical protein [Lachnospiraceae bacterium]